MKQRYLFPIVILAWLLFLLSCDKIEPPYVVATGGTVDPGGNIIKKVLVEEYTGHQCPNCPRGAVVVDQIQKTYGSKVIVMSVHAGFFARTSSTGYYTAEYRTIPGTEMDNFFGLSNAGLPKGMINRSGFNTNHLLGPDDLSSVVAAAINMPAPMSLQITNTYHDASFLAQIQVEAKTITKIKRKLMLSVFIVQDSIISPQKNGLPELGPDVLVNFVHRHVLRAAVNGTWGEELHAGQQDIPTGTSFTKSYQYTMNPAWNAKHIGIVAFVYDGENYEILQAAEKHLK